MKTKRTWKLILRLVVLLVALPLLYLGIVILIGTVTDYRPEAVNELEITGSGSAKTIPDSTFTFISWNIGFCGLGAEMDFFYDGGKMVHPEKKLVEKYKLGVLDFLMKNDSVDFFFLQEVDKNSARTRKLDEVQLIGEKMTGFAATYGTNYKVKFVPLPFTNPLGKVEMGQMNLSKVKPGSSQRYSYFSEYAWPKRLFMLDRCFVTSRFKLENGKELVLMNTHNSAYDAGGKLKQVEMPLIRDLMLEEYAKGNYVVAGGDWNQNPPDYDPGKITGEFIAVAGEPLEGSLFPEGWQIVYDAANPTNREIDAPLTSGKTEVTIIDYFILSPNISAEAIRVLSQNFIHSDHEPVYLKVRLR